MLISVANKTTITLEMLLKYTISRDYESDCDEILAEHKSIYLQLDRIR